MAPDKDGRGYKLHITNAFSGQLLLVSKRSKPESSKEEQPAADSISIVVNDSGSEMQSTDNADLSISEGFSQDEEVKCLKNTCIKNSKQDTKIVKKPVKKPVSILKPSPYDTDASDSDGVVDCFKAKAALPKRCKKKQKKAATEPSVAESSDSVDAASGESTSASEGESVAAAASGEESSKEESNAEEVATSAEQSEGTQPAEDPSIDEQSEGTQTADAPSINEQSDGTQTAEDPSINDKSEGTQTGDDEKPAEQTIATTKPSAAGDGWTLSKDALLRSMKDGGETWVTIASAISMHKNVCKARWKELSANGDGGGDKKEEKAKEKPDEQGKDKNQTNHDDGEAKGAEVAPAALIADTTLADNNVAPGDATSNDAGNEVSTAVNNKKQKQKKKTKLSEKVKKIMAEKNIAKATPGSDDGASSAQSGGAGHARVATWLGVHGPHYASVQVPDFPTPGNGWTAEDCAVLGTLERKRRVERWLDLQANFYNATGRMVSIEVLKDKVRDEA
ncbi:hypothetical protein PspLS_05316 [Pyricularia sp. CBS 133598]|nr:hypothetical protein PspLS_05316 [Pyricularia sp. CBS 133598]